MAREPSALTWQQATVGQKRASEAPGHLAAQSTRKASKAIEKASLWTKTMALWSCAANACRPFRGRRIRLRMVRPSLYQASFFDLQGRAKTPRSLQATISGARCATRLRGTRRRSRAAVHSRGTEYGKREIDHRDSRHPSGIRQLYVAGRIGKTSLVGRVANRSCKRKAATGAVEYTRKQRARRTGLRFAEGTGFAAKLLEAPRGQQRTAKRSSRRAHVLPARRSRISQLVLNAA